VHRAAAAGRRRDLRRRRLLLHEPGRDPAVGHRRAAVDVQRAVRERHLDPHLRRRHPQRVRRGRRATAGSPPMKTRLILVAFCVTLLLPTLFAQPAPQTGPAFVRHELVLRDFRTESGTVLPEARLVYTTLGTLNAAGTNAVLLPSHYMANFNGYN